MCRSQGRKERLQEEYTSKYQTSNYKEAMRDERECAGSGQRLILTVPFIDPAQRGKKKTSNFKLQTSKRDGSEKRPPAKYWRSFVIGVKEMLFQQDHFLSGGEIRGIEPGKINSAGQISRIKSCGVHARFVHAIRKHGNGSTHNVVNREQHVGAVR